MFKNKLIPVLKRLQIIQILDQLHFQGCCYGQPDCSGDDYINDCDCWHDDEDAELIRAINDIFIYLCEKEKPTL